MTSDQRPQYLEVAPPSRSASPKTLMHSPVSQRLAAKDKAEKEEDANRRRGVQLRPLLLHAGLRAIARLGGPLPFEA